MSRSPLLGRMLAAGIAAATLCSAASAGAVPLSPKNIPVDEVGCAKIEVIIARGTSEPSNHSWALDGYYYSTDLANHAATDSDRNAPYGIWTQIANELLNPTRTAPGVTNVTYGLNDLHRWDVPYPASLDFTYNFSSSNSVMRGTRQVIDYVNAQNVRCPNKRYLLFGYSQGALVVGNAISKSNKRMFWYGGTQDLSAAAQSKVIAVGQFADAGFHGHDQVTRLYPDGTYKAEWDRATQGAVISTPGFDSGIAEDLNGSRADGTFLNNWSGIYPRADDAYFPGFESKVRDYCIYHDPICQSGSPSVDEHLFYFGDPIAKWNLAIFALKKVRLDDTPVALRANWHFFPQAGLPQPSKLVTP